MSTQTLNSIASNELYSQYNWYRNTFPPVIQQACDEFFLPGFQFQMIGISKNINALMDKDSYFVTKIRIDKQYDMFFRSSEKTIAIILDRILGKSGRSFNLNKMTDLEAKIITAFNDYMFNMTSKFLAPPPPNELKRSNFDIIHITFVIKDIDNTKTAGKFIVSLPAALLTPESVSPTGEKFDNSAFKTSTINAKIKVGSTKFSMFDLKNLDTEDIVVFDNSNAKKMTLVIDDFIKEINLNPNLGLITPTDNNGGNDMGADNLWDSIEVEMNAEFDAVKITLGELKNIEEGLVVDLTSIYDNKVTLKVEDKAIARGELVIVNDRYGVKISEVIAPQATDAVPQTTGNEFADEYPAAAEGFEIPEEDNNTPPTEQQDEEFDYSDFELDDEDI